LHHSATAVPMGSILTYGPYFTGVRGGGKKGKF
jgi:hypothetical protein